MKAMIKGIVNKILSRFNGEHSIYRVSHPSSLQIEITNLCNLNCSTCGRHDFLSKFGSMSLSTFNRVLSKFDLSKIKNIHFGGYGEPLMNKDFVNMIEKVPISIYKKTNTNLNLDNDELIISLASSGINEINVSMDGFDKDTYEYVRKGASWEQLLKNLYLISEHKGQSVKLNLHCVVYCHNIKSYFSNIGPLLDKIHFDEITFVGMKPHGFNEAIESNKEYFNKEELNKLEAIANNKKVGIRFNKNEPLKKCFRPFHDMYITFDGWVTPCCNIVDNSYYAFGNLLNAEHLGDVWNSNNAQIFRKHLKEGDPHQLCSTICGLGTL